MFKGKNNNKILFLPDAKRVKNPSKFNGIDRKKRGEAQAGRLSWRYWAGTLIFLVLLTLTLAPDLQLPVSNMRRGDISPVNIKAKKDFLLEDVLSTGKNRELAEASTLPVYDFDLKPIESQTAIIARTFRSMENFYASHLPGFYRELDDIRAVLQAPEEEFSAEIKAVKRSRKSELDQEAKVLEATDKFRDRERQISALISDLKLNPKFIKTLRWHHYRPGIRKAINGLLTRIYTRGVVANRELLREYENKGIIIRKIDTGKEKILKDMHRITGMGAVEDYCRKNISEFINPEHRTLQRVVTKFLLKLVSPNLTFNKQETEARKAKAAFAVKPVFFNIKKGEMIVREGGKIGETQWRKLMGMNKESNVQDYLLSLFGLFIALSIIFYLAWGYLLKYRLDIVSKGKNPVLLGAIIMVSFLIIRLLSHFVPPIAAYLNVAVGSVYYAIPFAAAPMLAVLLLDLDIAILVAIVNFVLVGAHLEWKLGYALVALAGGLFSVLRKGLYKQRSSILTSGIFIGLLNMAMIVPLNLVEHTLATPKGLADLVSGFVGGITVTLVVSWLLPAFESFFHVYSDIKLQEISNLNHPLLRKMMMEAPGTYHHSIVVSTLAEGAAEAVGANSLLVRVGAYYHDIGKIKKPQYFIENQKTGKNRHDKLAPSMSALIVSSHVKEGVELARSYKLNPVIIDFIREHHGTSLMRFFYNKAREQKKPAMPSAEETNYRYGGPKPQTREIAIVLLADSVEAAARSLSEPSASRLQGLVEKIINQKLMEEELNECDLTLKDLNRIGKVFVRVLMGIFHSRIEYPESREQGPGRERKEGKTTGENRSFGSQEGTGGQRQKAQDPGPGNIKIFKMSG